MSTASNSGSSAVWGAGLSKSFGSLAKFGSAVVQYDAQQSALEHQKAMADIQAAAQMESINAQEREARDAAIRAQVSIQRESNRAKAQADVAAAASGTAGGSVEQTVRGINRSQAAAETARAKNYETQLMAYGKQREAVKIGQIFGNVPTLTIPPSPAAALADLSATMLEHNEENSPEGASWLDSLFGGKG